MVLAKLPFVYNNLQGVYETTLSGKDRLFINNQEVERAGKEWVLADGTRFTKKYGYFFIPKLTVNGSDTITLVTLKTWEWLLLLSPFLFIIFGGALPFVAAFLGIYINLSIVADPQKSASSKVALSVGTFISLFFALVLISGVLLGLLG